VERADEVLTAARALVGPCDVVADLSWTDLGLAVVLELRTAADVPVVAKGHAEAGRFQLEVAAYRRWVPAIADRAPTLLGADDEARTIVLSKLPAADPGDELSAGTYRDGGRVLRRFHDADASVVNEGWAADRLANLHNWIARMPKGLVDDDDVAWIIEQAEEMTALPPPTCVPCHGDWQPRNWRVDEHGRVFAFDFERARYDWWIHDVQRMWWQEWTDRPDLRDAFFEGYGRHLDDVERAGLRARSAAGHLVQIVWATEHGDAAFAAAGRSNLRRMRASAS
jgi:hypothetical protein